MGEIIVPTSWNCSIFFVGSNESSPVKGLGSHFAHSKHSGDKTTQEEKENQYLKRLVCIEYTCVKYKVMVGSDIFCRQSNI